MLDEIARLLDQLKSVGDNIAHDLRTPLAVARAKIERALNNEAGIEELREAMEAALAQIEKVSATISAILRVSAIENSARKTKFTDFDLASVCTQLLDFYEPLAESKRLTMIAKTDKPVPIRGDQDLMREALSNLIDNAIKFTPAGGVVRIEARMSTAAVRARKRYGHRHPAARAHKDLRPFLSRPAERPVAGTWARPQHRRHDRQSARLQANGRRQQPRRALRIARHGADASAGEGGVGSGLRRCSAAPKIRRGNFILV